MRRTKLICTIGPASRERVGELVGAGMDVARLNFSHGTPPEHAAAAAAVRREADAAGRPVAVLADLPGPKIRLGELEGGERQLDAGDEVVLRPVGEATQGADVPISYPRLAAEVAPGDRLVLADGAVELRVLDCRGGSVRTEVVSGGTIRAGAGLNAPSERLTLPAITQRDRDALPSVFEIGADYVAQSFVRGPADVRALRQLMGDAPVPIMAKIETRAAVDNLAGILAEADAVMLARGDLGVELPFAEVPLIQKRAIDDSVAAGVPVVVATQMLESMVSAPRPTRAEASDVANAVLDGADAVMLSAETAVGRYPVLAAEAAAAICIAAEADPRLIRHPPAAPTSSAGKPAAMADAAAIADAAVRLAGGLGTGSAGPGVAAIACFTRTGATARQLSRLRPACPVTALSPDPGVVRRMALLRSIAPVQAEAPGSTDEMIELLDGTLLASGLPRGAHVVLVASIPFGAASTNFVKLHRLGSARG